MQRVRYDHIHPLRLLVSTTYVGSDMPPEGPITVDIDGLRDLSRDLGFVAEEVDAIVRDLKRVPEPSADGFGGEPAAHAMTGLLSSWSDEVALLGWACTIMSETAASTADDWQGADERSADSFDLFDWLAHE